YLGYGLENDYKGKNVSEKIVIVRSGAPNITDARAAFGVVEQKQQLAIENGAVAVIELVDTNEATWGFIDNNFNNDRMEIASDTKKDENKKGLAYLWVHDENNIQAKAFES